MQTIPFSEARAHLADTLRRVEQLDEPAFISRRGEPVAVVMSIAQFERLRSVPAGGASRLEAWRAIHADALAEGGDDADWLDGVRDTDPGRDFRW
ncbi:type II toxin-antitoxin system Phd/YefM family antitoxin [Xylophilus sp.]|uniref:type II toxin-antitoxin system Phd/YefM family antitoxin n=1 Tax=Xylophilus sp. TaxID=2653893 RepID=UPI0013BDDC9A|nr:type II toxin-antitoxin system Phd/YefM family antitoxin [Xylophilus sp.]KAF1048973.1 MAG: hypothetical protein GAK38_01088 [Xylophilus sp.]